MTQKKKMNKALKVILIIIAALAVVIAAFYIYITWGMDGLKNAKVENIDISAIPDGAYTGEYSGNRWGNTVEVTIEGGAIKDIRIVKDQMITKDNMSKSVFDQVKEKQSLDIDAVSGATVTTKGYLKAIEDALSKAK